MPKFSLFLLLATAAAPAQAQADEGRGGRHRGGDAAEQSESRPQRSFESRRSQQQSSDVQRAERSSTSRQGAMERIREHYQQQRQQAATTQPGGDGNVRLRTGGDDNVQVRGGGDDSVHIRRGADDNVQVRGSSDDIVPLRRGGDGTSRVRRESDGRTTAVLPSTDWGVREFRGGTSSATTGAATGASTNWRARERRVRTIPETNPVAIRPSTSEREALIGRNRRDYRDGNYNRWSNNWRHDRRYDWDDYRRHHRSIYRLGYYYDPFGWNYRRWSIGSYLYPSYYRSSFWLNDPWDYRLPPAYGPYRWVRYWNDAFLVNIYTGEVVDVIHGFFW